MASDAIPEFGAGAVFGASLLASGVYSPAVIVSQMQLQNFHMLKSFLAASSVSAVVIKLADRSGWAPCRVRTPSSYGWFPYDANLVGGLLIGTGMTLTGACPGTVVVQVGTGIKSGIFVALGGLIGGLLYTKFAPYLRRNDAVDPAPDNSQTVQGKLNVSANTVFFTYEAMCLTMIALSNAFAPEDAHWLDPVVGGLMIGAAQAVTVLMTKRTVGVSTAYQDLARRFWKAMDKSNFPTAKLLTPAVTFAAGVLAGSAALAKSGLITISAPPANAVAISDVGAMIGGAAMVLGAGLARGCPSGNGISGMATFSLSSFISVAGMFGGGIAVGQMLKA